MGFKNWAAKLAQGGVMAMMGYEMGDKLSEKNVVLNINEGDLNRIHKEEPDHNDSHTFLIIIIVLIIVLFGVMMCVIARMCNVSGVRNRRKEIYELNNVPPAPRA